LVVSRELEGKHLLGRRIGRTLAITGKEGGDFLTSPKKKGAGSLLKTGRKPPKNDRA